MKHFVSLAAVIALFAAFVFAQTSSDQSTAAPSAPAAATQQQPAQAQSASKPKAKHVWTNEDFPNDGQPETFASSSSSAGSSASNGAANAKPAAGAPAASKSAGKAATSADVAAAQAKVKKFQDQKDARAQMLADLQKQLPTVTDDTRRGEIQEQINDLQTLVGRSQKDLDSAKAEAAAAQAQAQSQQAQGQQQNVPPMPPQ